MASAIFRFYAELNDFLPPERRQRAFEYAFDRRAAIKDVVEALGVPHTEIDLITIDGEPAGFDHILRNGERVGVYPMFEAFDIAPLARLRPRPLRTPRFVLDAHLGTLARYLRLLGFDTLYRNDYDDAELAAISAEEHRILLTRDRGLLKRRIVTHGAFVRDDRPRAQLKDIVTRLDLAGLVQPFSRCAGCNGVLEPVEKREIEHRLEPKTRLYYDRFLRCANCGHIYWKGSHFARMEKLVEELVTTSEAPLPKG
ncbi:MAG TPA: Mut7-C RNAse domain-containing protein [Gammaproteobacteria bacterium]|nr:Mut7-C RNAse domain-containing protein [Gammaproteobacteria bacterium]